MLWSVSECSRGRRHCVHDDNKLIRENFGIRLCMFCDWLFPGEELRLAALGLDKKPTHHEVTSALLGYIQGGFEEGMREYWLARLEDKEE